MGRQPRQPLPPGLHFQLMLRLPSRVPRCLPGCGSKFLRPDNILSSDNQGDWVSFWSSGSAAVIAIDGAIKVSHFGLWVALQ